MKSPLIVPLAALLAACSSGIDEARMTVRGYKVPCEGWGSMSCLIVSEDGGETSAFYDGIEGFTFKWGERVGLLVEKSRIANPPADGSSITYKTIAIESAFTEPDTSFYAFVSLESVTFLSDSLASVSGYEKKLHGMEIQTIKEMLVADSTQRVRLTISTQKITHDSLRVIRAERVE